MSSREKSEVQYHFIDQKLQKYLVELLCAMMQVSRRSLESRELSKKLCEESFTIDRYVTMRKLGVVVQ